MILYSEFTKYSSLLNTWGGSNKRGGRTICLKLINGEGRIILNNRGGWKFLWFLINREGDFIPNKRGDPKTYLIKGEGGELTLLTSLSNLIALPTVERTAVWTKLVLCTKQLNFTMLFYYIKVQAYSSP